MRVWSHSWLLAVAVSVACTSFRDVASVECMGGEVLYHQQRAVGCVHAAAEGRDHAEELCRSGTLLPREGVEYDDEPGCFICIYRHARETVPELAPGPYPLGFEPSVGCLHYFTPNDSIEYRDYLKKQGEITGR